MSHPMNSPRPIRAATFERRESAGIGWEAAAGRCKEDERGARKMKGDEEVQMNSISSMISLIECSTCTL